MGLRFWRRKQILPGVRLNMSLSGPSLSVGKRGGWFTLGGKGGRATLGLPGTGLHYTKQVSGKKRKRARGSIAREVSRTLDLLPHQEDAANILAEPHDNPAADVSPTFDPTAVSPEAEALLQAYKAYGNIDIECAINHLKDVSLADAHVLRGFLHYHICEFDKCIESLNAALAESAEIGNALNLLELSVELTLPVTKSIHVAICPDKRGVVLLLAEAYQQTDSVDKAIDLLCNECEDTDNDDLVRLSLADLFCSRTDSLDDDSAHSVINLGPPVDRNALAGASLLLYQAKAHHALGQNNEAIEICLDLLYEMDWDTPREFAREIEQLSADVARAQAKTAVQRMPPFDMSTIEGKSNRRANRILVEAIGEHLNSIFVPFLRRMAPDLKNAQFKSYQARGSTEAYIYLYSQQLDFGISVGACDESYYIGLDTWRSEALNGCLEWVATYLSGIKTKYEVNSSTPEWFVSFLEVSATDSPEPEILQDFTKKAVSIMAEFIPVFAIGHRLVNSSTLDGRYDQPDGFPEEVGQEAEERLAQICRMREEERQKTIEAALRQEASAGIRLSKRILLWAGLTALPLALLSLLIGAFSKAEFADTAIYTLSLPAIVGLIAGLSWGSTAEFPKAYASLSQRFGNSAATVIMGVTGLGVFSVMIGVIVMVIVIAGAFLEHPQALFWVVAPVAIYCYWKYPGFRAFMDTLFTIFAALVAALYVLQALFGGSRK